MIQKHNCMDSLLHPVLGQAFQFYFLNHPPSTNFLKSNWNETEVGIISHGSNLILVHAPSHVPGAVSKVAKASQKT